MSRKKRITEVGGLHELQCLGCSATLPLHSSEFRQIDRHMRTHDSIHGTAIHSVLAARIEKLQLADKTPLQLKFITESMKVRQEHKARIAAQDE
jgi:hypothetical protein